MNIEKRNIIKSRLDIFVGAIGLMTMASIVLIVGFYWKESTLAIFIAITDILILLFISQEIARWFLKNNLKEHLKDRWLENLVSFFMILTFIFPKEILTFTGYLFPEFNIKQLTLIYLAVIESSLLFVFLMEALRFSKNIARIIINPGTLFGLSFLLIIIIGTLFLMLPRMSVGSPLSFTDALFTSTSAVCVTGLIVVDTATQFTPLGKFLILVLIQIGGLGVMTLTTFFAYLFAGGISVKFRVMMREMLSQDSVVQVRSILFRIALFTFLTEGIGALFLYLSLGGSLVEINREYLYSSIFHSVSAFCNAGFSIYSAGLSDSLTVSNFNFLSWIMVLIVLGGLGFTVVMNIFSIWSKSNRKKRMTFRFTIATKIILGTTLILIILGFVTSYFAHNWSEYSTSERLFHSLFLSITTRTAGFNTIATESIAAPALMFVLFLMWVGASPGSTGGGIKTTTFAVNLLALYNLIIGKDKVELFNREISLESIRRSSMVIIASLVAIGVGIFVLVWIEPDKSPIDLVFEVISAISTVGLSRNITGHLGTGAKYLIIILMFIGRLGVLTFFLSFYKPNLNANYKLPQENLMIG